MDTFQTHDNYFSVVGEAQHNAAPVQRPPFLARHLAFWKPVLVSSGGTTSTLRKNRWTGVDVFLLALQRKLDGRAYRSGISPTPGVENFRCPTETVSRISVFGHSFDIFGNGGLTEFPPCAGSTSTILPSEVVNFEFSWWGLPVCLRFELHTEYLTLSAFVDLSASDARAKSSHVTCPVTEVRSVIPAFAHLADKLGQQTASASFSNEFEELYEDLWRAFERDLLSVDDVLRFGLGKVFADFRSIVLGRSLPKLAPPRAPEKFELPLWCTGQSTPEENVQCDDDSWQTVRRRFWPFLTTIYKGIKFDEKEFEVTQLLGGRALYMSALGPQPPEPDLQSRMPIFFLLYANTLNGWQLGRLVNQLHRLGTFRLAALIEFNALRSAGYELRGIERQIEEAEAKYHIPIPPAIVTKGGADEEAEHFDRQRDLRDALDASELSLIGLNSNFDGDIEYRIARSQYYIEQFRHGVEFLRVKRLQGYQRYDKFIERRLGAAFNFVSLLSEQYRRVISDRATLFQYYLEQQSKCVEVGTRNRNSKLVTLQRTAEYALIGCLLPYYTASIVTHIIGDGEGRRASSQTLWILIFAVCLSEVLRRLFKNKKEDRDSEEIFRKSKPQPIPKPKRLSRYVLLIAAATLVILLLLWAFEAAIVSWSLGALVCELLDSCHL